MLFRPLLATEWAEKGLEVVEVKELDVNCLLMPSTNRPIPGTDGDALR